MSNELESACFPLLFACLQGVLIHLLFVKGQGGQPHPKSVQEDKDPKVAACSVLILVLKETPWSQQKQRKENPVSSSQAPPPQQTDKEMQ